MKKSFFLLSATMTVLFIAGCQNQPGNDVGQLNSTEEMSTQNLTSQTEQNIPNMSQYITPFAPPLSFDDMEKSSEEQSRPAETSEKEVSKAPDQKTAPEVKSPAAATTIFAGPTTILITSSGFSPNNITVKSGQRVTFINMDSALHRPGSNPHPAHSDCPGFDAMKGLAKGERYSFTFTKSCGFHDHLNSTWGGMVTVE